MRMSSTTDDPLGSPATSKVKPPLRSPRPRLARALAPLRARRLQKLAGILATIYRCVAVGLLVVGAIAVVIVLILRNLDGSEPAWTVEGYTLALVMGGILFIGDVTRHIGYTGMPPITRRFPELALLVQLLFQWFVYAMLILQGGEATKSYLQLHVHTPSGTFPLWVVYATVPLVGVRGIINTLQQLAAFADGEPVGTSMGPRALTADAMPQVATAEQAP
jgi:TRAP-type C4-dicarboxylate transport system permease small subunit